MDRTLFNDEHKAFRTAFKQFIAREVTPHQQRWRDHFAWNEDATLIVGLTATGRATVAALKLNRPELVNLREVLYVTQKHPPTEADDE